MHTLNLSNQPSPSQGKIESSWGYNAPLPAPSSDHVKAAYGYGSDAPPSAAFNYPPSNTGVYAAPSQPQLQVQTAYGNNYGSPDQANYSYGYAVKGPTPTTMAPRTYAYGYSAASGGQTIPMSAWNTTNAADMPFASFRKWCLICGVLHLLFAIGILGFDIWTLVAVSVFQLSNSLWPPGFGIWGGFVLFGITGALSIYVSWLENMRPRLALASIVLCGLSLLLSIIMLILLVMSVAMYPYSTHFASVIPKLVIIPGEIILCIAQLIASERYFLYEFREGVRKKMLDRKTVRQQEQQRIAEAQINQRVQGWVGTTGGVDGQAPLLAGSVQGSSGGDMSHLSQARQTPKISAREALAAQGRVRAALPGLPQGGDQEAEPIEEGQPVNGWPQPHDDLVEPHATAMITVPGLAPPAPPKSQKPLPVPTGPNGDTHFTTTSYTTNAGPTQMHTNVQTEVRYTTQTYVVESQPGDFPPGLPSRSGPVPPLPPRRP